MRKNRKSHRSDCRQINTRQSKCGSGDRLILSRITGHADLKSGIFTKKYQPRLNSKD